MVVLPAARAHAAERIPKTYGAFLVSLLERCNAAENDKHVYIPRY